MGTTGESFGWGIRASCQKYSMGAICLKCRTKKLTDWDTIENCLWLQLFSKHEQQTWQNKWGKNRKITMVCYHCTIQTKIKHTKMWLMLFTTVVAEETDLLVITQATNRMNWTNNKIHSASHTLQCPSTNITLGRFGKFVTLELTYALYQSVIVWKRFAYSKRVTKSVGSSTHWNNKCDNTVKKGLLNSSDKGM